MEFLYLFLSYQCRKSCTPLRCKIILVSVLLNRSVNINWMILAHQYPHAMLPKTSKMRPMITCNSKKKGNKKGEIIFSFLLMAFGQCPLVCSWDFERWKFPMKAWQKEASGDTFPPQSAAWGLLIWGRLKCSQELGKEHKCELVMARKFGVMQSCGVAEVDTTEWLELNR